MTRSRLILPLILLGLTAAARPAAAQEMATGDAIRAAISGNTVQGAMSDATAYTEFYDASGTIKGQDYAGIWSIDGDTMCFAYGGDEAKCFGVRLVGDQVTWFAKRKETGTGTILPGNPNGF